MRKNIFIKFVLIFSFFCVINIDQGHASVPMGSIAVDPLPASYNELVQYAIPSPDQKKAGSCLYMASTGAMEILANKYFGITNPSIDGDYDLAELNALVGPLHVSGKAWLEYPILRFRNGGVLSRDLPFNSRTFWRSGLRNKPKVELPKVFTKGIFIPTGIKKIVRKKMGIMTEEQIEKVKKALVEYQAPVVVVYREAGYEAGHGRWDTWHTVVIMGYDDNGQEVGEEDPCRKVTMALKGLGTSDKKKLKAIIKKGGGCRSHGVFYVRDSEEAKEVGQRVPLYDLRSYDWLKYLGNHAFVAYYEVKE